MAKCGNCGNWGELGCVFFVWGGDTWWRTVAKILFFGGMRWCKFERKCVQVIKKGGNEILETWDEGTKKEDPR